MIRIIGSNRAKLNIMKEQPKNAVTEKLEYNLTECPMIGCHLVPILVPRQKSYNMSYDPHFRACL